MLKVGVVLLIFLVLMSSAIPQDRDFSGQQSDKKQIRQRDIFGSKMRRYSPNIQRRCIVGTPCHVCRSQSKSCNGWLEKQRYCGYCG
uniref:Conotoxin Im9.13 n=1 Tax=Conus imperialis TaxID=35631 RepID=M9PNF9_CONIM|nr:conotoxin Im9.13 [Conus imperialis]